MIGALIDPFRRLGDDFVKPVPPEGWTLPFPGTVWFALRPPAGQLPSPGSSDVALGKWIVSMT